MPRKLFPDRPATLAQTPSRQRREQLAFGANDVERGWCVLRPVLGFPERLSMGSATTAGSSPWRSLRRSSRPYRRPARKRIELAGDDALEPADGLLEGTIFPSWPVKTFATLNGCDRKRCNLRGGTRTACLFRQLVHAQDRDDVLQFLVTLEKACTPPSGVVVLFTDDQRIELAAGGVERIDRR